MSRPTQKQHDEEAQQAAPEQAAIDDAEGGVEAPRKATTADPGGTETHKDIPRWRQIEIMQERAQLREALGDFDAEFDELDDLEMEVFGSESENETLYQHNDAEIEEDVDLDDSELDDEGLDDEGLDDEGLDDEDFEDFDDD